MGLKNIRTSIIAGALILGLASSTLPFGGEPQRASANQISAVITNPHLSATQSATFSALIRCVGRINHPPFGVNLKIQTDQGLVNVPWFTSSWNLNEYAPESTYNQQGFRDFEISWELSRQNMSSLGLSEFQIDRVLYSKEWRVSASTTSCNNEDLTGVAPTQVYNQYFSQERSFDGPRVEFAAKSLAIRQGTAPTEIETIAQTFYSGFGIQRQGENSLFSIEPICSVIDDEGKVLTNTEIAQLEPGDSRAVSCDGGILKAEEAWRADSFVGSERWGAGRLHILGESQWALADEHFSSFKDDLRFLYAKVPLVLPAGPRDAVYVFSEHGEGPPDRASESRVQIGALVGSNGMSLSTEFGCSVNHGSAVATSPTSRIAVGAGMSGTGNYGDAELVRFSFDENSAECAYAFSERVPSPIRSLAIEDADHVLALHGTTFDTISRITFPDIVADPDAEFEPAPQQDFAFSSNLELQAIVTDSTGEIWGVSQIEGEIKIWQLTLVPPVLNVLQPDLILNDLSRSFHGFTFQGSDVEEEPPVGTVIAEEWLKFEDDDELLVGFETRGNFLTVSTYDQGSWSYFTSVRSFAITDKSEIAVMHSNPGEDCFEFFGLEDSCGGYLLGVDARNGVAILADYGDLGRTGPATSGALRQLSESWMSFGSSNANRGTLSNDGEHAWLFNSDDATFERVALEVPSLDSLAGVVPGRSPNAIEQQSPAYLGPTLDAIQPRGVIGSELVLTGQRLGSVTGLRIGGALQAITLATEGSIRFRVSPETKVGANDVVLVSSFGTLTVQSVIQIEYPSASVKTATKSALVGETRILSKNSLVNQSWFSKNLKDSGLTRITCTALVSPHATKHQRIQARKQASIACAQAAGILESANVWFQTRETTRARMSGRVLITFRG